jgi:hypothetical protein
MSWVILRLYFGKVLNALGIPAPIQKCDYSSTSLGARRNGVKWAVYVLNLKGFQRLFTDRLFHIFIFGRYNRVMQRKWKDPAKQPPKPETMNTPGDFERFTDLMRKIVQKRKSVSPGVARS